MAQKVLPKIYFTKYFNEENIRRLFLIMLNELKEINKGISDNDVIAVKTHFGEKGNTRFVKPELIKPITDEIKKISSELNCNCFITDSNTLYRGQRLNAKDHVKLAKEHGFDVLGIPIIIADGMYGDEEVDVEINKNIFDNGKIAKKIYEADVMVLISHFKGHMLFGFGGAIKNLGMGCSSRAGKLKMHSKIAPYVKSEKCTGCEVCIKNCAVDAISLKNGKAMINNDKCTGCAKCISVCPQGIIMIPWHGATSNEVQERCAEHAFGAVKNKKLICINFINNITKDCDCLKDSEIIGNDIGIVASLDPVACDKASYDLVKEKHGKDIFIEHNNVDGTHILDYAEEISLGVKEYELIGI